MYARITTLVLTHILAIGCFRCSAAEQKQTPGEENSTVHLTFLHLADVYRELPVDQGTAGGLARIATLRNSILRESPNTIFLFAGDTISPSVASHTFKGKQMIAAWNAVGIDCATLGNHELDFGLPVLEQRVKESKFPWLCANAIDKRTGKLLPHTLPYVLRDLGGIKVGIIGLLTPDTLQDSISAESIQMIDLLETARKCSDALRKEGAQLIVGLTHLSMVDDQLLAGNVPVDIILGGHEHSVMQSIVGRVPIYKEGSDARNLGRIDVFFSKTSNSIQRIDYNCIPVNDQIKDDKTVAEEISAYEDQLKAELAKPIFESTVDLDATQLSNESRETALGNLIADAYRSELKTDIALLNGGSIRADCVFKPGIFTKERILTILPFEDPIVSLEVTGSTLRAALENSVSLVGKQLTGRFPQISGMTFSYDATKPAGARVVTVLISGKDLDDNKRYSLATNGYIAEGGDGYSMLKSVKRLISHEHTNADTVVVLNMLSKLGGKIAPHVDGRIKRLDINQL